MIYGSLRQRLVALTTIISLAAAARVWPKYVIKHSKAQPLSVDVFAKPDGTLKKYEHLCLEFKGKGRGKDKVGIEQIVFVKDRIKNTTNENKNFIYRIVLKLNKQMDAETKDKVLLSGVVREQLRHLDCLRRHEKNAETGAERDLNKDGVKDQGRKWLYVNISIPLGNASFKKGDKKLSNVFDLKHIPKLIRDCPNTKVEGDKLVLKITGSRCYMESKCGGTVLQINYNETKRSSKPAAPQTVVETEDETTSDGETGSDGGMTSDGSDEETNGGSDGSSNDDGYTADGSSDEDTLDATVSDSAAFIPPYIPPQGPKKPLGKILEILKEVEDGKLGEDWGESSHSSDPSTSKEPESEEEKKEEPKAPAKKKKPFVPTVLSKENQADLQKRDRKYKEEKKRADYRQTKVKNRERSMLRKLIGKGKNGHALSGMPDRASDRNFDGLHRLALHGRKRYGREQNDSDLHEAKQTWGQRQSNIIKGQIEAKRQGLESNHERQQRKRAEEIERYSKLFE